MKLFKKNNKPIDIDKFNKDLVRLGIAEPLYADPETIKELEKMLEAKRKELEQK